MPLTPLVAADVTPKATTAQGESQVLKTEEQQSDGEDNPMDFEEEMDDEIQVYYENEEIEQANEKQRKDQFDDIQNMKQ